MNAASKKFLFDLLNTPSPTGFEIEGQRKWAGYVRKFSDAVGNDAYGTAWATLEGRPRKDRKAIPTVMLEAHADEIGYTVKYITSEGYLHIDLIGGSDAATARGKRITILGDKGPVQGVIGNTAIHIRENRAAEKAPKIHELYVDVGARSDKETEKLGIRVGHPAVYSDASEPFGKNRLVGRALDNRLGGFIIAQVMANLSRAKTRQEATVFAVNSVQEEVGGHGAKMVAHRLMPDVAVVLDVTHATDTPGIEKSKHGQVTLGGGPTLTHGIANHPKVVERLNSIARKSRIPIQHEATSRYSGTDTERIFQVGAGIPSALVSLPLRYMHSIVEMADFDDVEKTIDLLTGFVKSVRAGDDFSVKL